MNKIAHFINPSLSTKQEITADVEVAKAAADHKKSNRASLFSRICSAATVAFKTLAATALYWINPSLFAIGFFAGIIYDKQAESATEKIRNIWLNQPWVGTAFIAFACALSLPVSLAAGSLLMSAHLGSSLSFSNPSPKASQPEI